MKYVLSFLIALPLAAQQPAPQPEKPAEKQEAPAAKPEEQKPAAAPAETANAEKWLTGSVDVGARFLTDIKGDLNTYRSVVNLGEGLRLLGLDLSLQEPSRRLFDRLDLRMNNWGGDPYNTARLYARKARVYNLNVDYRNLQYFNFMPSFADPLLPRGIIFNERGFDTYRRMASVDLELMPGRRIVPYLAFDRNSGSGSGTTVFDISATNEYPVPNRFQDRADNYRGGVRFEFNRFHVTLEQGGIKFRDDQEAFSSGPNTGNSFTPIFGQRQSLTGLSQAWGVRGNSIYTKAMATANPVSWLDLSGQFLYSQPHTDIHYAQANTGNFFLASAFQFYNGQAALLDATAQQPHSSGSFSIELRPMRRIRVVESFMTDRLHNATAALLAEQFLVSGRPIDTTNLPQTDRLVMNYSRQEVNVIADLLPFLTLRGGHRFVWGDSSTRTGAVNPFPGVEMGELRQHVGLAGLTVRFAQKLSANVDFEGAAADRTYFRTSLHDYQKGRAQVRYQLLSSLSLSGIFTVLHNENPEPGINYSFTSRNNTLALTWTPGNSKWVSLLGEYTRSTLRSDIFYRDPVFPTAASKSFYRDNAHTGTALVDLTLPGSAAFRPKLAVGGSFFTSSGSRPTQYYEPTLRLGLPIGRRAQWNTEWKWYSLQQPFYIYEGFRTHQFVTGFRLSM